MRDLRTIALATWYLHLVLRPEVDDDRIKELVDEGTPLKRKLLTHAKSLAEQRIVSGGRIAAIEAGRGHFDLANDLVALADLFRESWDVISEKMKFVEEAELVRAAEIGTSLLEALGAREVGPEGSSAIERAMDTRWRAFTLLAKTYDEIRTAVGYVRRKEGDADAIAPSLHTVRNRRRVDEPAIEVEPVQPADDPSGATPDPPVR